MTKARSPATPPKEEERTNGNKKREVYQGEESGGDRDEEGHQSQDESEAPAKRRNMRKVPREMADGHDSCY